MPRRPPPDPAEQRALRAERYALLRQVEHALDGPMVVLGLVWLVLLVVELVWALSPFLTGLVTVVWIVFILNFALEFGLAPSKRAYLRRNWLTAVSLVVPAVRVLRVVRVLRLVRGLRLVKVVASLNRGMRAIRASFRRRGMGYVATLTVVVTLAGAAGMHAFEDHPGGLETYGEAVWWTSMIMTTLGSAYWPETPEGRVLCVLLALYGFGIFGYVTATLATYFVGRDAEDERAEVAGAKAMQELTAEVAALRAELRAFRDERP